MLLLWVTRAAQNQFALIWGPYQIFLFSLYRIPEYLPPPQPTKFLSCYSNLLNAGFRKLKRGQSLLVAVLKKRIRFAKTKFLFCFLSCKSDYRNFRTPSGMCRDCCYLRNLFRSVCWSLAIPGWGVDKSCDSYLITIGQGVR